MRRPSESSGFFSVFVSQLFLPAEPPLSPPFHPHSCVSDFSLSASWVFSFQPVLVGTEATGKRDRPLTFQPRSGGGQMKSPRESSTETYSAHMRRPLQLAACSKWNGDRFATVKSIPQCFPGTNRKSSLAHCFSFFAGSGILTVSFSSVCTS